MPARVFRLQAELSPDFSQVLGVIGEFTRQMDLQSPEQAYTKFPTARTVAEVAAIVGGAEGTLSASMPGVPRAASFKSESKGFTGVLICDSPYLEVDHGQIAIT